MGGGSNLILGIGTENQIFILRTPAAIKFFSSYPQTLSLWCKNLDHSSPIWICMIQIWFPTEFPRGIIIFQGVLTKFQFFDEISTSGKKLLI